MSKTNMSFGQAPKPDNVFDALEEARRGSIQPAYGINEKGEIVSLKTGEVIDPVREAVLQRELATTRAESAKRLEMRRNLARSAAQTVIADDFSHLVDVPASSRASISKSELIDAIVKGIILVHEHHDRAEAVGADGM